MAAFQKASSPDAFEKQRQKTNVGIGKKAPSPGKLSNKVDAFKKASSPDAFEKQKAASSSGVKTSSPSPGKLSSKVNAFKQASSPDAFEKQKSASSSGIKKSSPGGVGKLSNKMDAFKKASSPDAFDKQRQKARSKSPTPGKISKDQQAILTSGRNSPFRDRSGDTTPDGKPAKVIAPGGRPKQIDVTSKVAPQTGKIVENRRSPMRDRPKDWDYLYELAVAFDHYKAMEANEKKKAANEPKKEVKPGWASSDDEGDDFGDDDDVAAPKKDIRSALEATLGGNYTAKADWLNREWITERLIEEPEYNTLIFKHGDPKLFKRFDKTDSDNRKAVISKFVTELLNHPRSNEITMLNLCNCLLPDEFLEILAEKVLANPKKGLQKLQVLNLETNLLQGPGIEAIAKCIENESTWKYLQVILLENQKKVMTTDSETALANAVFTSPSIVVVSHSFRGGLERQLVNGQTSSNIDVLRQARREHASKTGTLKARKRNDMEQYFDKIAANDSSITSVDLVGDTKFLGLKPQERTKTGAAFEFNTHVKTIKMVKLQLDDDFARALGNSLSTNSTIENIVIDSNAISGEGIQALFKGLSENSTLIELQVRHQSKTMSSTDEDALPDLLEPNQTITKLGVDTRNQLVKMKLDRKTNANREHQRKLRAAAAKK